MDHYPGASAVSKPAAEHQVVICLICDAWFPAYVLFLHPLASAGARSLDHETLGS
jgi:hypothetical protein